MTHAELVKRAAKWLAAQRFPVIITELVSGAGETPDAMGFNGWSSTLIECKASIEDFKRDSQKHFRRMPETGMGDYRYFMAPKGIIPKNDLPERWGLLEVNEKGRVFKTVELQHNTYQEKDYRAEFSLLVSLLRRIGQDCPKGVSIKCYTYETKNTATLGLRRE